MLVEHYYPQSLSQARLDKYLASGWFRSAPMLYRSQLLCLEGDVFSTVNIRIDLEEYTFKKSFQKIMRRNEQRFEVRIQPARLDEARDALYQTQKHRFKGFIFDHLPQFFFANLDESVFDTWEVGVYDGDRLVAVSFFDQGKKSLASILGLYHPDYEKYSLGTYTMLNEILYGIKTNRRYHYPGYVLDKSSIFDYKLRFGNGKMQFYDWKGRWKPYEKFSEEHFMVHTLREKIQEVEHLLSKYDIPYQKLLYPMFSVGYLAFMGDQFVKSPVMISCYPDQNRPLKLIVEYILEDDIFRLSWASLCPEYQEFLNMHISEDLLDEKIYTLNLLRTEDILFQHASSEKLMQEIIQYKR
jgi:arginine-tRNA-protein transferase